MFSPRISLRRKNKDEAEKPFWISFSDLMTALMVLFLVAMVVALVAVTQGVSPIEPPPSALDTHPIDPPPPAPDTHSIDDGAAKREKSIQSCIADVIA